jgi:transposase
MFVRVTRNKKGDAYYHLVESFRDHGKVRQRLVLSLGRVEDGMLEKVAAALNKHLDTIQVLDLAKHIDIENAYVYGSLLVLERLMEQLGISQVIENINQQHDRLEINTRKVLFTLIASRFIKPVSKLALHDRWLERLYPEMVDHDLPLQHIYRSLDLLATHKDEIEQSLYRFKKDLFSIQVDVVLYDLTTLRFESTREDLGELRKFGYSKEMRSDCTQIVFGLLTDTDGMPLSFEVHPGNTFEGNTLDGIVDRMKKQFSVRRFIFIADRGLFSAKNLEHIRKSEGEFIVGLKIGVLGKAIQQECYDIQRYHFISQDLAIWETTYGSDRCIITWSRSRAERDYRAREDILSKIRKKLTLAKNRTRNFVSNSNYKKYLILGDHDQPILNQKAIDEQARKDGFFGIITNVTSMTAREIVFNYKQLWKIEDSFGELKGTLKSRPIFHWSDHRIIGHLMVCFLAYLCEAYVTKELRLHKEMMESKSSLKKTIESRPLTAALAFEELNTVLAIPVKIKEQTIWVRTDIPKNAQQLLQVLHMKIPPKILMK